MAATQATWGREQVALWESPRLREAVSNRLGAHGRLLLPRSSMPGASWET